MVVTDHLLHPLQPACDKTVQELFPATAAFTTGEFHAQYAAPSLPVHTDGHQHRPTVNNTVLSDFLVTGIQNQIRVSSSNRRRANLCSSSSSNWVARLIVAEENSCPHSSSVMALTLRVDTP